MRRKWFWVGIPVIAALCIVAYVYFAGGPQSPATLSESELPPEVPAASGISVAAQSGPAEQTSASKPTLAPDDPPLERKSETKGDLTDFSLSHGDIGYVDMRSIMEDRNPYSIVDLLQAHHELTGADESLEIAIESISENEICGQEVFFRQLIAGQPTNEV